MNESLLTGYKLFSFLENEIPENYNLSNISCLTTLKLIRFCVVNGIPFGSSLSHEKILDKLKNLEDFYMNGTNLDRWTSRQPIWKKAFGIKRPVHDLKSSILGILHRYNKWPGCNYPELWQEFLEIMMSSPYGENALLHDIKEKEFHMWTGRLCQEWVLYKSLRLFPDRPGAKLLNDLMGGVHASGEEIECRSIILLQDCLGFTNSYRDGKTYCNYVFNYVARDENQPERLYCFEQIISPDKTGSNGKIYHPGDRVELRGITGKNRRDMLLDMWLNDLKLIGLKPVQ